MKIDISGVHQDQTTNSRQSSKPLSSKESGGSSKTNNRDKDREHTHNDTEGDGLLLRELDNVAASRKYPGGHQQVTVSSGEKAGKFLRGWGSKAINVELKSLGDPGAT
jgi:hypothetical protein